MLPELLQPPDYIQDQYDAERDYGVTRPESSPIRQIERGEFEYDDYDSPDYVEEGDSAGMMGAIADKYFQAQPSVSRQTAYRYNQMLARDAELPTEIPRATIAIPIAIHNEDAATLKRTLDEIAKQTGVEQDEIVLFGNMPEDLDNTDKLAARQKFDEVIAAARETNPQLNLRSAVVEYDQDKLCIGRVRHDYMNLIAWDASQRGFGADHPVIMLDADTKQMTRDMFTRLSTTLTAPDSDKLMAHAEFHYLFDEESPNAEGTGISDIRKLAILQEIRRRQYLRTENWTLADDLGISLNDAYNKGHYDEEWGMSVALGAYLLVGGYNERGTLDESRDLTQRLYDEDGTLYDVMSYAKPDITNGELYNGMYYLTGTSVRGSSRRHEQRLREWVAGDVNDKRYAELVSKHIQYGHQYSTGFGHTDALRNRRTSAEPAFKDIGQAKMIVKSVLTPDSVERMDGTKQPLPDPKGLLKRLGLPHPDDK